MSVHRLVHHRRVSRLDHLGRHPADQEVQRARRLPAGQPQPAVVGGGAVGDGHAALGDHDDRHDRPGLCRRHAVPAVLLRPADRDDRAVAHARAVLPQRARVHRLRVPGEALRRQDADADLGAVPGLAGDGHRRRRVGAGGVPVGGAGRERHQPVPADGAADGRLHHVRRRAGGGLDRRQADGPHRRRAAGGGGRAGRRPARRRRPGRRAEPGRDRRPPPGVRLPLRPHRSLHVLVGHARRVLPLLLLLRHRPEPGAAVSHRQVGGRGAHVAADERLLEDSAAGAGAAGRRADLRLLRVHAAADAVQHRPRRRGARQRQVGRLRGRRGPLPDGARRPARGRHRLRARSPGRAPRTGRRPRRSWPPAPRCNRPGPRRSAWSRR